MLAVLRVNKEGIHGEIMPEACWGRSVLVLRPEQPATSSPARGCWGKDKGGVQGCHRERDHSALSTAMEKEGQELPRLQSYTHEMYNTLYHNAKIYVNAMGTTLTKGIINKDNTGEPKQNKTCGA